MPNEWTPEEITKLAGWEKRADGWWLSIAIEQVAELAQQMLLQECRLVTLTGRPWSDNEIRIDYHWDKDGQVLTAFTVTQSRTAPSILALCPAADWAEREIHDYFAVQFSGRTETEPLMLRKGDRAGVYFAEGGEL